MGILMSAFSVASIVGLPIGIFIAIVFGAWQAPFAVLGGIAACVLIAIQLVLPRLPRPAGDHPATAFSVASRFLTILLKPGHLLAYSFMTALVMSTFLLWPTFPTYLEKNIGIKESALVYVYVCGGVATLVDADLVRPAVGSLWQKVDIPHSWAGSQPYRSFSSPTCRTASPWFWCWRRQRC